MASMKISFALFLFLGFLSGSMCEIYQVGDAKGWNTGIDYEAWASCYKFRLGDSIVFNFNNGSHNVREVTEAEYNDCSAVSPISTYTGGKDQIILDSAHDRYFICSFPGMCEAGQKVRIKVVSMTYVFSPPPPPATGNYPGNVGGIYPCGWKQSDASVVSSYSTLVLLLILVAFYLF